MADRGDEVETLTSVETPDIKLFGRWSPTDVDVKDMGLQDYIAVKVRKLAKSGFRGVIQPVGLPHRLSGASRESSASELILCSIAGKAC